ncbi:hypothetical protein TNCV_1581031 [Trichonephila clavipes]|nr:hypothetical protein TNCV_1581031 [Trichonephila clavipes]
MKPLATFHKTQLFPLTVESARFKLITVIGHYNSDSVFCLKSKTKEDVNCRTRLTNSFSKLDGAPPHCANVRDCLDEHLLQRWTGEVMDYNMTLTQ